MEQLLELEGPKQQAEAPAAANAPAPLSKEEFRHKCIAAMEALREQGKRADLAAVFVRVATWELAKIVDAYGKRALTDVLHQFAAHLDHLDDLDRARREADEAKAAGRLPQ